MKIAISSHGNNLDAPIDPRFGRCANFVIVETEDMGHETDPGQNKRVGKNLTSRNPT